MCNERLGISASGKICPPSRYSRFAQLRVEKTSSNLECGCAAPVIHVTRAQARYKVLPQNSLSLFAQMRVVKHYAMFYIFRILYNGQDFSVINRD